MTERHQSTWLLQIVLSQKKAFGNSFTRDFLVTHIPNLKNHSSLNKPSSIAKCHT